MPARFVIVQYGGKRGGNRLNLVTYKSKIFYNLWVNQVRLGDSGFVKHKTALAGQQAETEW